jgi:PTS system mannose-specific IIB component
MKNIVFARIDDRLLHGQVIVSWIPFLDINEIVIVDDEYSADEFMAEIIKEAAPENVTVNVLSTGAAEKFLSSGDSGDVLLISRRVETIDKLITMNVKIGAVNVGGLGYAKGRNKYKNAVYMSDDELGILKKIASKGIAVQVQMLPGDKAEPIMP